MKKNCALIVLCFFIVIGNAQKYEITSDNPHFVKIKVSTPVDDRAATVVLQNTHSSDIDIYWDSKFITGTEEWKWHICDFNKCYSSLILTCPNDAPVNISQNSKSGFIFALEDDGLEGAARYEFCFWVKDEKEASRQCVEINFNEVIDAVDNIEQLESPKVFPNPASEYISLTNASGISFVEIYSLLGRKIKSFNVSADGSYNITDLHKGLYITHLINKEGRKVKSMWLKVQ